MRTFVCSVLIALGAVWLCVAGPVRPIRSEFFNPQQPSGPPHDQMAIQGQWFFDPHTEAEHVKSWEFHDDWHATNDESWTIKGVVTNIVYDGTPSSNIVAFDVLATVYNNLPSDMPPTSSTNSHDEVQSPSYPGSDYAGSMLGTRITAEFAIADMSKLPNGIPPYFTDPVSHMFGSPYFIEALNEHELAWYCWNPEEAGQHPGGPGDYQVPAWILGDIPPGQSRQVLMQFHISGGVMSSMDYRHSVIRYSMENDADLLYNRHSSLKISHWLDTLLIDSGAFRTAPPGEWEFGPEPEYIYASNASVFFDPEMDFGDAPPPYPTLLINNGARHLINTNVFLGKLIDAEPDGQPDPNALGDDNNNLADEDGVTFTSLLIPGQSASIEVECSVDGFLSAWIDFNGNGSWADLSDQIFAAQAVVAGTNSLTFQVPASSKLGPTFARFRFTTKQTALGFTGLAEDGEVEDYEVTIHELDFGDAWDCPSTPAYPTLLVHDGARHIIVPGVYLGAGVDSEPDGQPDFNALGDDQDLIFPAAGNIPYPPGDEDGVVIPSPLIAGATVSVQVTASVAGYLNAWIDWNANSTWEPGEHVYVNYALSPGVNHLTLTVPDPPAIVSGGPHSRWRFTTYAPVTPLPTGLETDGEVEDYEVKLEVLDFGDAPAPYPTLLVDDGARHMIPSGYWLGLVPPDHEPDGQPDPDALGDDNSGVDDEDGVTWVGSLIRGSNTTFNVVASTNGVLNAWIDFNRNGSWSDSGEQIANDVSLVAGTNALSVAVPSDAALGKTFGRFRFSSYTGLAPTGIAYDGEVEDYALTIYQTGPSTDIVITNITVNTSNDTVKIEWIGESPVLYETHYADALSTSTTWTAWGGSVTTAPYEQTNSVPGQTSRFYRVVAPYTAP